MSEILELMRTCGKSGVKIAVNGQKLKIDAPTDLPDSIKDALRRHKANILRILTNNAQPPLSERLHRMIAVGVSFDVSANDFQTIDGGQILKTSDKEFLKLNAAAILCTLQYSLLVKHLFSHAPEQLEDFACAVAEREAIMIGDGRESFSIHCEAVKDVSKNWFIRLLADIAE